MSTHPKNKQTKFCRRIAYNILDDGKKERDKNNKKENGLTPIHDMMISTPLSFYGGMQRELTNYGLQ